MSVNPEIIYKLLVTGRAMERAGDEMFSHFGITLGMYEILALIGHKVDTTTRLARESQITLASITHKTKIMEDKGYIRRVVGKADKRVWHFSLTPKGLGLLQTIQDTFADMALPLFAQFSESEKRQALDFLAATEQHLKHVLQNRRVMSEYMDALTKQKRPIAKNIGK